MLYRLLDINYRLTHKHINTNSQRMKLDSTLGQLRLLAILEGISYLLLIPTVILKYGFEIGMPNKIVGSIHGLLFVLYSLWVVYYAIKVKWSLMKTFICLLRMRELFLH